MKVYHVCSKSLLRKYQREGKIRGVVRAWKDIISAERFSCQTGRPIILRLKFPEKAKEIVGHKEKAVFIDEDYILKGCCEI